MDTLPSALSGVAKAVRVQHGHRALGVEDNPLGDGRVESSLHQQGQPCQSGATHNLQSSWD